MYAIAGHQVQIRNAKMAEMQGLQLRRLNETDPQIISDAFKQIGWRKTAAQYERYLAQQSAGTRVCLVAEAAGQSTGYVTVNWIPTYPGFVELKLPPLRRHGIATRLLDEAEWIIAERSKIAGIGVGLHPGYNAAQRLYVRRGYVPDGRGVTYITLKTVLKP